MSKATVHPTAIVEDGAVLEAGAEIGPYCRISSDVVVGAGTRLLSHVVVEGPTRLGARNVVYPFASIGTAPQDRRFAGERTEVVVGDENVLREQVTVHRGTRAGGGTTRIGSRCLLMVGAHVAHDALVEDDVVLTNLATLGGHVHVERGAVLGGHVAVAPFARIGELSFLAGGAKVERSVPPFVIAAGDRARVRALNVVGLRRNAVPQASRAALRRAFRLLWRSGEPLAAATEVADREFEDDAFVSRLVAFIREHMLQRASAPGDTLPGVGRTTSFRPSGSG